MLYSIEDEKEVLPKFATPKAVHGIGGFLITLSAILVAEVLVARRNFANCNQLISFQNDDDHWMTYGSD